MPESREAWARRRQRAESILESLFRRLHSEADLMWTTQRGRDIEVLAESLVGPSPTTEKVDSTWAQIRDGHWRRGDGCDVYRLEPGLIPHPSFGRWYAEYPDGMQSLPTDWGNEIEAMTEADKACPYRSAGWLDPSGHYHEPDDTQSPDRVPSAT